MTDAINTADMGQANYLKLFMQELTYQDPLKPIDNREFMAQMAQFSALQQAAETNNKLDTLINLYYGNRGLSLVDKHVTLNGEEGQGTVESIRFEKDKIPEANIHLKEGGYSWIGIDHIYEAGRK